MSVAQGECGFDKESVDHDLAILERSAQRWVECDLKTRAAYLEQCMQRLSNIGADWAQATSDIRGLDPTGAGGAEAWLSELVPTMRTLRLLRDSLRRGGIPPIPKVWRRGSRLVAQVFPTDTWDASLFTGVSAEVHLVEGEPLTQGRIYRNKAAGIVGRGQVGLVLGAGNVGSICPTDALHKLFVDDEVVVIKTNPVNAYLSPFWRATLKPLIDDGFVRILDGGVELGTYLCQHPVVQSIHITGSDATYDAIVWGGDAETNKKFGDRVNRREVSAELGCVTPVIIVPGRWSAKDIEYQASNLAAMITNNASFNCVACKAIVVDASWDQKAAFLSALRQALHVAPARRAYYPGAASRYQSFLREYPSARVVGREAVDAIPWTLLEGIEAQSDEYALSHEAFCGVVAQVELVADGVEDFLMQATRVCNESIWGTLSCSVIIDPESERRYHGSLEKAIDELHYGGVAVNVWSGLIFGLASPPWGAAPGHTPEEIGSGTGFVHNTYLIDKPHKTVLRAPFRIAPRPVWFDGHIGALEVAKRMFALERERKWTTMFGIVSNALRG